MSPVHVIVGTDARAEAMWADAFSGAIDLYRFDRNVDAFERLTAAQAPIDLVILTPAQGGPFNLTPDQFVARVLEGPMARTSTLANLHVIVVGSDLARQHPRAVAVPTLGAAIRLVKFGELDEAPRPISAAKRMPAQPARSMSLDMPAGSTFSDSVISRIWSAADSAPTPQVHPDRIRIDTSNPVIGGGPTATARLFATPGAKPAVAPGSLQTVVAPQPITGGGPAHLLANALTAELQAPTSGSAATIATPSDPPSLPASRNYVLPNGGAYRGPAMRRNQIPPASSHGAPTAVKAPVPPAIGSQIHSMVYANGAQATGDPVLSWTSGGTNLPVAQMPIPTATVAVPAPSAQPPVTAAPVAQAPAPALTPPPMQPPAGVYGSAPAAAPTPNSPVPAIQADPFGRRVVEDGGVSFG